MKKIYGWTLVLILFGFVLMGVFLTVAPDQIPVHYNIQGQVDRWGSKYEFGILPVLSGVFGLVMVLMARHEGKQGREMNGKVVGSMSVMILVFFNAIWLFFMWKAVDLENPGSSIGELPVKGILMLLSALLIVGGDRMPKAERNSMFGLRTKWSMANDWCWQQSQRVGGFVSVVAGVLGIVLSALLPAAWAGYALVALIIAMTLICSYASYRIFMRSQNS